MAWVNFMMGRIFFVHAGEGKRRDAILWAASHGANAIEPPKSA